MPLPPRKRTRKYVFKRASRSLGCPTVLHPRATYRDGCPLAILLAVLVFNCSALLLCAGAPRHFVARDTVTRRGATVQMGLSSLVSDHPLATIAVTAAVSSAAGTALGVFVLPSRRCPASATG